MAEDVCEKYLKGIGEIYRTGGGMLYGRKTRKRVCLETL